LVMSYADHGAMPMLFKSGCAGGVFGAERSA
jgi:hypothetical protein